MNIDEVIRYFQDPQNREKFLENVPESLKEDRNRRLQNPQEVRNEYARRLVKNQMNRMWSLEKLELFLGTVTAGIRQKFTGERVFFVGKDGSVEQLDLSDRQKALQTFQEQLVNQGKLLVQQNIDGTAPNFFRYEQVTENVRFFEIGNVEITAPVIKEEKTKEPDQLLEQYNVPEQQRKQLLQKIYLETEEEIHKEWDAVREVDERLKRWHHLGEIQVEEKVERLMKQENVPHVALDGMGLFNEEEMQILSICAGVGKKALETCREDGSSSLTQNVLKMDTAENSRGMQLMITADLNPKYTESVYGRDDERMKRRILGFMKGNQVLMDAVQKAAKENDYKPLIAIVREGMEFYKVGLNSNSMVTQRVLSQSIILGKIGQFLDQNGDFAREMNLSEEERKKLKGCGDLARDVKQMKQSQIGSWSEKTEKNSERRKAILKDYFANELMQRLAVKYSSDVGDMLRGNTNDFPAIDKNNPQIFQKKTAELALRKAVMCENLPANPILQAAIQDGGLQHIKGELERYVETLPIFQKYCEMDDDELKETIQKGEEKAILIRQAGEETEKNSFGGSSDLDEAREFVAKSLLPDKYRRLILEMKDNSGYEDLMEQYGKACVNKKKEPFEDLRNQMDRAWQTASEASLWWKKSGNFAQMYQKLKEIRSYLEKHPDNQSIEGDKMNQMLAELKQESAKYLAEKDGTENLKISSDTHMVTRQNVTGKNGQKRYDAAYQVYLCADSALLKEQSRRVQQQAEKRNKTRIQNENIAYRKNCAQPEELLEHLKKQFRQLPLKNITKEELALAVIESIPWKEPDAEKNKKQQRDVKQILTALSEIANGEKTVSLGSSAQKLLTESIKKVCQSDGTIDSNKLQKFDRMMISNGWETYATIGGRLLNMLGEENIRKGTQKELSGFTRALMKEGQILDQARAARYEEMTRSKQHLAPKEENVRIMTVAMALITSHGTSKKNQNINRVFSVLKDKEVDTFIDEVYKASGMDKNSVRDVEELQSFIDQANLGEKIEVYAKKELTEKQRDGKKAANPQRERIDENKKENVSVL